MIIQLLWNFILKCHIHYFTIIYILLAILAQEITYYLLAMLIVMIHEMCHYFMACYMQYSINKVEILPFGAFMSLDDFYSHSILAEACVILAGPCSHIFIHVIILLLPFSRYKDYLYMMNKFVFLFNLLPIYPLDGGRFIGLLLESLMDLKTALYFHMRLSILSLCILSIFYLRYQTILTIAYLFLQQINYYRFIPMHLRLYYAHMQNDHHKIIIHDKIRYRRDYHNYYSINNQIYDQQQVLFALYENI